MRSFATVFRSAGHQCHLVGGAVRDLLLGRDLTDFDIATDARPEVVLGLFRRVIPTGIRHGTVTVLFRGTQFEVTTFRTDGDYSDGRRPDTVVFAPSIFDDLARRDFTINAMAYDLLADRLNDPHRGREDLKRGILRAIGDPAQRFHEDGLRPLRACRFAAQLAFTIEPATRAAIPGALPILARVSAERVRDEILKILASTVPSVGLLAMQETGILGVVLPELAEGIGVAQGDLHCYDVFHHSLYACDAAPRESQVLRLAALLHDVGKPRALGAGPGGRPTFYGHEKISTAMSQEILTRLKLPGAVIKAVCHLVANHMFNYQEEWTDAAVRRLISKVGEASIGELMALRRADQIGMCRENAGRFPEGLSQFAQRVEEVQRGSRAFTLRDLAASGTDLMERLGLRPGPEVGILLNELLETVLEDPSLNERERLLQIAERMYHQRMAPGQR
ncbi:MAG TPA: CCA tRNA nucleotidyltransferase [Spirochaetia bacterium]|nr:CCA tRNA nucleotidyltransferase [Spirochaetia bacterium]